MIELSIYGLCGSLKFIINLQQSDFQKIIQNL
jgi:hypothetical protein